MSEIKELTVEEKLKTPNMATNEEELKRVAEFISDFDPRKDKYKRTLEAQGYVAARRANMGGYNGIAKSLGLPYGEFKYYLETKPEFAAAIRKGIIDGKEEIKDQLIDRLIDKARGLKLTESKTEYAFDEEGIEVPVKKTNTVRDVAPDTQAILEVLGQLDPMWKPKAQLDVNVNSSLDINVTENKLITVDLRKLSPTALKEILEGQKTVPKDPLACKREDGKSINSKNLNDDVILIEEKPKRQMSEETKEKLRQARIQTKEAKAKKKKDLEDKLKLEEINNENSTKNE